MTTTMSSPTTTSPTSSASSINAALQSLPPLNTSAVVRRATSQRPPSYAKNQMSIYSVTPRIPNSAPSRPSSHVFPMFHSSLPYTLVRDFAYPVTHPAHYGPPPHISGLSTPVSEVRRLSDPAVSSWDEFRGGWSATPPWSSNSELGSNPSQQLPAMTFSDGGPPYSEDEDLHSPVVTTRHKKHKSTSGMERGRSPGAAQTARGMFDSLANDGNEDEVEEVEHDSDTDDTAGGSHRFTPSDAAQYALSPNRFAQPNHRDSHFAAAISRPEVPTEHDPGDHPDFDSEAEDSEMDDDGRFSRNYSFTIASPDEEMHGKAVALFDFESEHQNELPLREGQIILVSYRHGQGWLVAQDPKSGESGLVPEEFVRLVRDIEGGLNGLHTVQFDGGENGNDLLSPASANLEWGTPALHLDRGQSNHSMNPSNGGIVAEKHPPTQSSFSTSSKDLEKYPLPSKTGDTVETPTLPSHLDER